MDATTAEPSPRRPVGPGIRHLIALVALVAAVLGWVAAIGRAERSAARVAVRLGCEVAALRLREPGLAAVGESTSTERSWSGATVRSIVLVKSPSGRLIRIVYEARLSPFGDRGRFTADCGPRAIDRPFADLLAPPPLDPRAAFPEAFRSAPIGSPGAARAGRHDEG